MLVMRQRILSGSTCVLYFLCDISARLKIALPKKDKAVFVLFSLGGGLSKVLHEQIVNTTTK